MFTPLGGRAGAGDFLFWVTPDGGPGGGAGDGAESSISYLSKTGPLLGSFSRMLQNNLVEHPDHLRISSGPGAVRPTYFLRSLTENTQCIP